MWLLLRKDYLDNCFPPSLPAFLTLPPFHSFLWVETGLIKMCSLVILSPAFNFSAICQRNMLSGNGAIKKLVVLRAGRWDA